MCPCIKSNTSSLQCIHVRFSTVLRPSACLQSDHGYMMHTCALLRHDPTFFAPWYDLLWYYFPSVLQSTANSRSDHHLRRIDSSLVCTCALLCHVQTSHTPLIRLQLSGAHICTCFSSMIHPPACRLCNHSSIVYTCGLHNSLTSSMLLVPPCSLGT